VWLARDESLDAEVAVKVMADNWADRMDLRERFLREARMLRQASSYRIVQVFDIGELEDGRPYLVMEYADRGTLAERVRANGPYPLPEALRITAEVARGIAELHAAGVVHRDLKPSNVLISSVRGGGERLLVADLGVAKSLAHGSGVTMSVGSAGYMAPEQAEPQIGVDVRADVYSLGAFAYHLITADRPGLPMVIREKLPPDLPPAVRRTLLSALAEDRQERWPDAASLAERLDELAEIAELTPDDVTVAAPGGPIGLDEHSAGQQYPAPNYPAQQHSLQDYPARQHSLQDYPARQHSLQDYPGQDHPGQDHQQQYPAHPYPGRIDPGSAPDRHPQPGRGRWIAATATLAVLAAAGAGGALYWRSLEPGQVSATSADGVFSLNVPATFGSELIDSGWDPGSIGLKGDHSSGLLLADSISAWPDLGKDVNGVFVGVSTNKNLPDKVAAITHEGCQDDGSADYTDTAWTGTVTTWTNCTGTHRTVREIALEPADDDGRYVYLQIRQADDEHTADELIAGLRLDG